MSGQDAPVRSIAWGEVLPFLRLFRTFRLSIDPMRVGVALLAVASCYIFGRVLDSVWLAAGGGAVIVVEGREPRSELQAYFSLSGEQFRTWKHGAVEQNRRLREEADRTANLASETAVREASRLIDKLLIDELNANRIADDAPAAKRARKERVSRAADHLRHVLARCDVSGVARHDEALRAIELLSASAGRERREEIEATLRPVLSRQEFARQVDLSRPRGPFGLLLEHATAHLSAAVRAACTGNWGFSSSSQGAAVFASLASAGGGFVWLVSQRPVYAVIWGLGVLALLSFFAGAITRHAAIKLMRDEYTSWSSAFAFARAKFIDLLLAPGLIVAVLFAGALVIAAGSLFGTLPFGIGSVLMGVFFVLAMIIGVVLALVAVGGVFGFAFLWPTVSIEGSDSFDALSHANSFVTNRPWHVAFYSGVLVIYSAICMAAVRLIALLSLKFTHACVGAGLGVFGGSSDRTATIGRLDAIWRLPDWSEISLLPLSGDLPFWGSFFNAPLSSAEATSGWLIALWVFLFVGMVIAIGLNMFLCGSVILYTLLRRDAEGVEWDEIFVEEDDFDASAPAEQGPAGGASLPVIN